MNTEAFLNVAIDKKTKMVVGVAIHSEQNPSTTNKIAWATLSSVKGKNFGDAYEQIRRSLTDLWYEWLKSVPGYNRICH